MRFPFFSRTRKAKKEGSPAPKVSRVCCFQLPKHRSNEQKHRHPDTSTRAAPTVFASDEDVDIRHDSTVTHITSLSAGSHCPGTADSSSHVMQNLLAIHHPNAVPPNREDDDTSSSAFSKYGHRTSQGPHRTSGEKTPRKGPGLGSVNDKPPTRMPLETHKHDFHELSRSFRKRDNAEANAPALPTRLEVCVDRCPRKPWPSPTIIDSAVSISGEKPLPSHALAGSYSLIEDSLLSSSGRRSQSPPVNRMDPISAAVPEEFQEGMDTKHPISRPISRQSSDSGCPDDFIDQPTKQQTEEKWDFDEQGFLTSAESSMRPTTSSEGHGTTIITTAATLGQMPHGHPTSRLAHWQIELKLDWISECSNDLVAEVSLMESTDSISQESSAMLDSNPILSSLTSSSSSTNKGSETHQSKNTAEKMHEDYAKRDLGETHFMETAKKQNQARVVYIVDRILTELQKQKRHARNKELSTGNTIVEDCKARYKKKAQTLKATVGTERYRRDYSLLRQLYRRLEVLQSFEVLVAEMYGKVAAIDGSDSTVEFLEEKLLAQAVLGDLRDEITRLERDFENEIFKFEEADDALAMALNQQMPSGSLASRRLWDTEKDGYEEQGFHWNPRSRSPFCGRLERATTRSGRVFYASAPAHRSLFNYCTESPSSPESPMGTCLPDQRIGMQERLAKIASVSEELFFASDSDFSQ